MKKFLYFTIGSGGNASEELACYPTTSFKGFDPVGTTTLNLYFTPIGTTGNDNATDVITLTIVTNTHAAVIRTITDAINYSADPFIVICDKDNSKFINSNITDCVIYADPIVSVNKISGSTQVKLIDIDAKVKPIQSISLSNIHTTDAASTDLFLANPTDNYYIFKNVSIPAGTTLVLDNDEVNYDTSVYNLYVKLGASGSTVDVIIKS